MGADWNIALGQVKFEILCRDGRGLLAFDWISIPAAGGQPVMTISKDTPPAPSATPPASATAARELGLIV